MAKQLIDENASTEQDQDSYKQKYSKIEKQFKEAEENSNKLIKEKILKEAQAKRFMIFAETFRNLLSLVIEWDYKIWNFCVDFAICNHQ